MPGWGNRRLTNPGAHAKTPDLGTASGAGGLRQQGEVELEAGAVVAGGADHREVAVLAAGQLAGDVEPEADPAGATLGAALQLGEAVEDALALGLGDAGAGVLDGQDRLGALADPRQPHRLAVGRVLAGVVEQVAEDLHDRVLGDQHGQGPVGLDRDLAVVVAGPGLGGGLADQVGGVQLDPVGPQRGDPVGLLEAGGQQQLLDHAVQPLALLDAHGHQFVPLLWADPVAPDPQDAEDAHDRGQGAAQLVGDGGDQVGLEPVGLLEAADDLLLLLGQAALALGRLLGFGLVVLGPDLGLGGEVDGTKGQDQGRQEQQAALGYHHRHRGQGQDHGRAAQLQAQVVAAKALDDGHALVEADHDADQQVVDHHEGQPAGGQGGQGGGGDLVPAAEGVVDGPAGSQGEGALGGVEQRLDGRLALAEVGRHRGEDEHQHGHGRAGQEHQAVGEGGGDGQVLDPVVAQEPQRDQLAAHDEAGEQGDGPADLADAVEVEGG